MPRITVKAKLQTKVDDYSGEREYQLYPWDMGGYVLIQDVELEFDVPDETVIAPQEVAILEAAIQNIRATAFEKETELQSKINRLLSLTFTPAQRAVEAVDDDIPF